MKKTITKILVSCHVDSIFRKINRNRLLVLNYHGLIESGSALKLFTQLPVELFEEQIRFLKSKYNVITLSDFLLSLKINKPLPYHSALITFDDGFASNYTLAFPILRKYNLPATIFLAVDYIGTENLLWFDELYLLIAQSIISGIDISELDELFLPSGQRDSTSVYTYAASKLKKLRQDEILAKLNKIRNAVGEYKSDMAENFKLLNWDQVTEMKESGLIEFGTHTATHRILSTLPISDFKQEVESPKVKLSEKLGCDILSFAYPNGIPNVDFNVEHQDYLKIVGYECAFSTGEWLNSFESNPYCIGRICVGSDITSQIDFYKLNTSGFINMVSKLLQKALKINSMNNMVNM